MRRPEQARRDAMKSEVLQSIRRDEDRNRQKVAAIADRFDAVADDSKYEKITALHGFSTLRLGLREFALPPRVRQGRIFANHLDDFKKAMEGKKSGASWKAFFEMDELAEIARSKQELKQADQEFLAKMLQRFDSVSQDSKYGTVKKMRGFDSAHDNLKALIQAMKAGAMKPAQESSPKEADVKKSSELKPQPADERN
jgi:hypothetical protein